MNIRENRASCLMRLLSLIIIGVICFYIGAYKDRIANFIEEYMPDVKKAVGNRISKIKASSQPQILTITPSPEKRLSANDQGAGALPGEGQLLPRDIRIASFYISSFSDNDRVPELLQITHIIKYFDVIAVQGGIQETALKKIVDILKGLGLTYAYTSAVPSGDGNQGLPAFLYRPDNISLVREGTTYRAKSPYFVREPFYATFQAGHFDFTLVSIHVSWGTNEEQRRSGITELPEIYNFLHEKFPREQDIILLGHFNLPPDDPAWDNLKLFPTMAPLIRTPDTTNISGTRLYDNLWFQQKYTQEYTGCSGVIKFDENMFGNNDQKAGLSVSVYRPVWADFRVTQPDDD